MKEYSKPKMVAKNAPSGSYVAGCPTNNKCSGMSDNWHNDGCKYCERTR